MIKTFFSNFLSGLHQGWKEKKIYWIKLIVFFIFILFLEEWLYRRDVFNTLAWPFKYPLFFLMNLFTLLGISSILILITERFYGVSMAVGIIALLLGAVNSGKMALRNVPLSVEDFSLLKEVLALSDALFSYKVIVYFLIGAAAIFALSRLLKAWYGRVPHSGQRKMAIAALALSLIMLGVGQMTFSSDVPITETGFIYALSNPLRPEKGYSEAARAEAEAALKTGTPIGSDIRELGVNDLAPGERPNIIIIQSEAFWDVNRLGIEFTKNPIENFEALRNDSLFGRMYVPVVGGGTSNTEFELLTGMTLKNYMSDWYMVYPNEVKSPQVTLASILRKQGYVSVGTHPYMSWYYNRREVYKYFGFNRFVSMEYMDNPEIIGAYTSDDDITDRILKNIETETDPVFDFVVTMQNHGPYGNHRFDTLDVEIADRANLSDPAVYFLNNYVQGLYLSDQALARLIETLKSSDEPTLVMFFGDHLPMLGEDYLTYRESGYIGGEDSNTLQQSLDMMSVPYIIWTNYGAPKGELPVMNASFMTPRLLELIGAQVPEHLKAVLALSEKTPVITRSYALESDGTRLEADHEGYEVARAQYQLIWERVQASDDPFDVADWIIEDNQDYNAELNTIEIQSVASTKGTTVIRGTHLYQNAVLSVDGSEQEFNWVNSGEIEVERSFSSGSELQLKLFDSDGTLLAASSKYVTP